MEQTPRFQEIDLTPADLAARLTGREYGSEMTNDEEAEAKAAGLVVVFGASDDLMEFRGAISDELGACGGATARVTTSGLLPRWEYVDKDDEAEAEDYFRRKLSGFREVEACWDTDGYSWVIKTDIPHATFEIVEDGDTYCRGIVFALADIASAA